MKNQCQTTVKYRDINELNQEKFWQMELFKVFAGSYISNEVWSKGEQIYLMLNSTLTFEILILIN